jgi:hypothetical protein
VSCIDVTIMDRFAHSALPSPYSKVFPAFRTGAAATPAAGLGGKRFIDFIKPHACVVALVQQHGSECTLTRIEHRLGQSSLCERGGIQVANEDRTVGLDQTGAQLMQEIFAPIRDLGVNRSGSVSMAGAPCDGQRGFQVAVKALRLDRCQRLIREGGKSSQPQIDAQARDRAIENRLHGGFISLIANSLPREVDLSPSIANRSDFEGYPAERAARPTTLAPGQPNFLMLSASPRVFFRPNSATSRAGHPYSIPKIDPITLSLAGLNADVSRGEIG